MYNKAVGLVGLGKKRMADVSSSFKFVYKVRE